MIHILQNFHIIFLYTYNHWTCIFNSFILSPKSIYLHKIKFQNHALNSKHSFPHFFLKCNGLYKNFIHILLFLLFLKLINEPIYKTYSLIFYILILFILLHENSQCGFWHIDSRTISSVYTSIIIVFVTKIFFFIILLSTITLCLFI